MHDRLSKFLVWDSGTSNLDGELGLCAIYQLRRLCQITRLVGQEVAAQLVSTFILSRLDYCNSVLAGLPQCTTEPLQHVLNAAARLVLKLRPNDHVTPALQQMHWLPIDYRLWASRGFPPPGGNFYTIFFWNPNVSWAFFTCSAIWRLGRCEL